ncbi:MAG: winged helix-turn-helix transcriptional regulator [Planctomycetes bacterium]|nr:winged helix-turn-helix transcriptional regulator [Planctomycetota bacterium]
MTPEEKKLYEMKAQVIAAAGHPIRLAIIDYLKDGEQCVCDIAEHVGAERSNVSRHLAVLLKAGMVSQRKEGLKMMYSLRTPCVLDFTACVVGVLRKQATEASAVLRNL